MNMTFLDPCPYKKIRELAESSYKTPRLLPLQYLGLWSDRSEPQIPTQLILPAPDCHWWSQRAPSICLVQPGRAPGTDGICPLPRDPQQHFWAQAEMRSSRVSAWSHTGGSLHGGQAGLGSGFLGKENLWTSTLHWKIFSLQRAALAPHSSQPVQSGEHWGQWELPDTSAGTCPCILRERRLPGDSWEVPKEGNIPLGLRSSPSSWPSPSPVWVQVQERITVPALLLCQCLSPVPATVLLFFCSSQQREKSRWRAPISQGNGILQRALRSSDPRWDVAVPTATLLLIGLQSRVTPGVTPAPRELNNYSRL